MKQKHCIWKGVSSLDCKSWISSLDGKYRSHCYQYHPGVNNNTWEAEALCKKSGGHLAPYVDEEQFMLWKDIIARDHRYTIIAASCFLKPNWVYIYNEVITTK
jgi:hypothetical protein